MRPTAHRRPNGMPAKPIGTRPVGSLQSLAWSGFRLGSRSTNFLHLLPASRCADERSRQRTFDLQVSGRRQPGLVHRAALFRAHRLIAEPADLGRRLHAGRHAAEQFFQEAGEDPHFLGGQRGGDVLQGRASLRQQAPDSRLAGLREMKGDRSFILPGRASTRPSASSLSTSRTVAVCDSRRAEARSLFEHPSQKPMTFSAAADDEVWLGCRFSWRSRRQTPPRSRRPAGWQFVIESSGDLADFASELDRSEAYVDIVRATRT